jgi:hypothetical protein
MHESLHTQAGIRALCQVVSFLLCIFSMSSASSSSSSSSLPRAQPLTRRCVSTPQLHHNPNIYPRIYTAYWFRAIDDLCIDFCYIGTHHFCGNNGLNTYNIYRERNYYKQYFSLSYFLAENPNYLSSIGLTSVPPQRISDWWGNASSTN